MYKQIVEVVVPVHSGNLLWCLNISKINYLSRNYIQTSCRGGGSRTLVVMYIGIEWIKWQSMGGGALMVPIWLD